MIPETTAVLERATTAPLITIVVPNLNQGLYLETALDSIFSQDIPVEAFVMDGGSSDQSQDVIHRWKSRLAGWRSGPDAGQSAAINYGIQLGKAPFVAWLNADDFYLPGGLQTLLSGLAKHPESPAAYGRCWTTNSSGRCVFPYLTAPFSERFLANYCFIAQPGTLIRRAAWEQAGGLRESLHMCMDYDLWWRLYKQSGRPAYVRAFVAAARVHRDTKTATRRRDHYLEAMRVVREHYGSIPLKWHVFWPLMVTLRSRF